MGRKSRLKAQRREGVRLNNLSLLDRILSKPAFYGLIGTPYVSVQLDFDELNEWGKKLDATSPEQFRTISYAQM